ncbi:MAG TPA: hypothetical protein VIL74_20675 [Pyrinomonadaceae bacterium]|jgi:hypothetical protein
MAKNAAKKPVSEIKPANSKKNPDNSPEIVGNFYSISALSRKFKLDRATVRERLEKAEIKPKSVKEKEKLYLLEDVEIVLLQSELNEAKLRKIDAEAELKELEVKKKLGEFGSVAEFTEITQKIFGQLFKKIVVQMPGRIASRLHNANSSADVAALLKKEAGKEFDELRENFEEYLGIK